MNMTEETKDMRVVNQAVPKVDAEALVTVRQSIQMTLRRLTA